MSSRTAESNKAIRVAWIKEQELVQNGEGTREWTPQQQQDIIDKGKAYDDDGVAFQGQHMKSAEKYPEYQGDSGNIQFLTRTEHLEAHDGDWRNPTNWYFNPITKEKIDFGDRKFIQCEIIQLAEPINKLHIEQEVEKEANEESAGEVKNKSESNPKVQSSNKTKSPNKIDNIQEQRFVLKVKSGLKNIGNVIVDFPMKYPKATKMLKGVGIAIITAIIAEESSRRESSNSEHRLSDNHDSDEYKNSHNDYPVSKNSSEFSERSSPDEHTVKGHGQHYHYKDGSVKWKEKDPYPRGANKNEK